MRVALEREEPVGASGYRGPDAPRWEEYSKCVHCGLCLTACPTYRLLGVEMDSPRGRIHQMILVDQGRLKLADSFVRHIDLCLDCRACEIACPSGVEYGKLVEAARAQIEQNYRRPLSERLARSLVLRHILPQPKRIALLGRLLRFYQTSGLQALVRGLRLLRPFGSLQQIEQLLPPMDQQFFFDRIGQVFPPEGIRRARVAFFAGCIANVGFARLNEATVRVLQKNGCEVVVPAGQVCCGALHVHTGLREVARQLARTNLRVFLREDCDTFVTNAAGCGSTLKEYAHLFPADAEWRQRAEAFQARMLDVTEFLAKLGVRPPTRGRKVRVTYQDPCHLAHAQQVRKPPRELLAAIPGVEFVEMKLADYCCGSAGIYNIVQPTVASQLLCEKMEHARATGARLIVTANPGCLLQLRAGARLYGTGQEVLHLLELLDHAYAA